MRAHACSDFRNTNRASNHPWQVFKHCYKSVRHSFKDASQIQGRSMYSIQITEGQATNVSVKRPVRQRPLPSCKQDSSPIKCGWLTERSRNCTSSTTSPEWNHFLPCLPQELPQLGMTPRVCTIRRCLGIVVDRTFRCTTFE